MLYIPVAACSTFRRVSYPTLATNHILAGDQDLEQQKPQPLDEAAEV
jgi:hypothetical protein